MGIRWAPAAGAPVLTRRHLRALAHPFQSSDAPPAADFGERHGRGAWSTVLTVLAGPGMRPAWTVSVAVDRVIGKHSLIPVKAWSPAMIATAKRLLCELLAPVGQGEVDVQAAERALVVFRELTDVEIARLPAEARAGEETAP